MTRVLGLPLAEQSCYEKQVVHRVSQGTRICMAPLLNILLPFGAIDGIRINQAEQKNLDH
jgi:hypothetical protein